MKWQQAVREDADILIQKGIFSKDAPEVVITLVEMMLKTQLNWVIEKVEGLKLSEDEVFIEVYEFEMAPKILANNKARNRVLDEVLTLLNERK
jgi:hypothetical protein